MSGGWNTPINKFASGYPTRRSAEQGFAKAREALSNEDSVQESSLVVHVISFAHAVRPLFYRAVFAAAGRRPESKSFRSCCKTGSTCNLSPSWPDSLANWKKSIDWLEQCRTAATLAGVSPQSSGFAKEFLKQTFVIYVLCSILIYIFATPGKMAFKLSSPRRSGCGGQQHPTTLCILLLPVTVVTQMGCVQVLLSFACGCEEERRGDRQAFADSRPGLLLWKVWSEDPFAEGSF